MGLSKEDQSAKDSAQYEDADRRASLDVEIRKYIRSHGSPVLVSDIEAHIIKLYGAAERGEFLLTGDVRTGLYHMAEKRFLEDYFRGYGNWKVGLRF